MASRTNGFGYEKSILEQLRYPLVCIAAIVVLSETVNARQLIGAGIILFGLLVMSSGTTVHPPNKTLKGDLNSQ